MMPQSVLYDGSQVKDSLEGLFAAHGRHSRAVYWTSLVGVLGGLVALPLIKVDVSVRAAGLLRPASERTAVRSAVSGYIAHVYVRDNDRVEAGQALLQLQPTDVEERIRRNQQAQGEHRQLVADLVALTDIPPSSFLRMVDRSSVTVDHTAAAQSAAGINEPTLQTAALRQERAALSVELATYELAEDKAKTQLSRYEILSSRSLVSQQDLDNTRFEYARLVQETKLLIEQAYSRWEGRLRDERATMADLVTEGRRLDEELTHFTLRAPERGVLIGFTGLSAGSFVAAEQTLGEVSPNDALKVEAFVSPRDIGLIHVGQAVRLQIDAFPYSQWGVVEGIVESISGDMLVAESGNAIASGTFFKATINPLGTTLRLSNGVIGELRKGMTLSARFLVARRTLLQVLYEDASKWVDPKANPAA